MIRVLLAVLLLTAPAAAQEFEGRSYRLTPGTGAGPLILALHGGGGSGRQLQRSSPIDGAAQGATVVYPSAPNRVWNDGRWSNIRRETAQRDDAGYLLRLAAHLAVGLTDRRVFVIGHSNGGGMAMTLACTDPGALAGIAVVATKMLADAPCPNPGPVPTILFHGTLDPIAPHDGQRTPRQVARMGPILSSDATLAGLAGRNRCTGRTAPRRLPPLPDSGIVPVIDAGAGCAAPLRRVTLVGGGHGFPGTSVRAVRERAIGPSIPDYDAAQAAMMFWGLVPAPR